MRYILPGIVFAIFIGVKSNFQLHATGSAPGSTELQSSQSAQTFVNYANALAAFQSRNPTFVGTVTGSQLSAIGISFSADFLATATNKISAFGSNGRTLTAYAQLQPGALGKIIELTEADASYGTSNGSTWTSVMPGALAQPITLNAPLGSVVYQIQLGH